MAVKAELTGDEGGELRGASEFLPFPKAETPTVEVVALDPSERPTTVLPGQHRHLQVVASQLAIRAGEGVDRGTKGGTH